MFQSCISWTELRTREAASAAPIKKPENPVSTVFWMVHLCVQVQGSCDQGGIGWFVAGDIPSPL